MRRPRSRRSLLASVPATCVALTGCFEGRLTGSDGPSESGVVPADAYDCDDTDRPAPSAPSHDEALEPADYPDPPESVLEEADDYVREFEESYRRNEFLAEYGPATRAFDFRLVSRQVDVVESEDDRDGVLVSIVYHLTTETRQADQPDEWDTRVTYYVDENVVFRARYDGIADSPSFDPDPRDEGVPVTCLE